MRSPVPSPPPSEHAGPPPPSVRRRSLTALFTAGTMLATVTVAVFWFEADREVGVLCGLMTEGTPPEEVARLLGTAEMLQVRPADVDMATATVFAFDAPANLRTTECAVTLDGRGVTEGRLTRTIHLEQMAALAAAGVLLLLSAMQIGLATGRISGRMAWGGRFDTLPPPYRRASAITALLLPFMAWVLLERAAVIDVMGGDGLVRAGAWAVVVLFLFSTAGNLASSSVPERRVGIPTAAAMAVLAFIVAYAG